MSLISFGLVLQSLRGLYVLIYRFEYCATDVHGGIAATSSAQGCIALLMLKRHVLNNKDLAARLLTECARLVILYRALIDYSIRSVARFTSPYFKQTLAVFLSAMMGCDMCTCQE